MVKIANEIDERLLEEGDDEADGGMRVRGAGRGRRDHNIVIFI